MKITINYKVHMINDKQSLLPNFKINSWRRKYKRNVNVNVVDGGHFTMSLVDEDISVSKEKERRQK